MPTSSVGRTRLSRGREEAEAGVTLIEMMVVVGLISLMIGISFPAITSGIDSLRLKAATNSVVSFLNAGLSRAERRQQVIEITISKQDESIEMQSTEPGFTRTLQMPEGISIVQVLPQLPENPDGPRTFFLYPSGAVPPFGVQLINRRNVQRVVRVDPITGVPRVEMPE
jgi:type II secretory pathway pseudopilin PulG